ncbi:MAG: hypothetical protein QM733_14705 [Ilumatobacteraceae bacterium]
MTAWASSMPSFLERRRQQRPPLAQHPAHRLGGRLVPGRPGADRDLGLVVGLDGELTQPRQAASVGRAEVDRGVANPVDPVVEHPPVQRGHRVEVVVEAALGHPDALAQRRQAERFGTVVAEDRQRCVEVLLAGHPGHGAAP